MSYDPQNPSFVIFVYLVTRDFATQRSKAREITVHEKNEINERNSLESFGMLSFGYARWREQPRPAYERNELNEKSRLQKIATRSVLQREKHALAALSLHAGFPQAAPVRGREPPFRLCLYQRLSGVPRHRPRDCADAIPARRLQLRRVFTSFDLLLGECALT